MKGKTLFLLGLCIIFVSFLIVPNMFAQSKANVSQTPKAGISFAFGTVMQQFQKSTFKQGTGSYYKLIFSGKGGSNFFLHNEQTSFNVEEGTCRSVAQSNAQGIGATMPLGATVGLNILVGGATVIIPAGVSVCTATGPIFTGISSTDSIADIGIVWRRTSGNTVLNVGLAYRSHKLSSGITVTPAGGTAEVFNDLSSINLGIDVGYAF